MKQINYPPMKLEDILKEGNHKLNRSQVLKKQRYLKWSENPKCHWCGVETIFIENVHLIQKTEFYLKNRNRLATIDHLYSRYNKEERLKPGHNKRLLSCWKCNNDRAKKEAENLVKEDLWKLSGRIPKNDNEQRNVLADC